MIKTLASRVLGFLEHFVPCTYAMVCEGRSGRYIQYLSLWLWQASVIRSRDLTDPTLDQRWLNLFINDDRALRVLPEQYRKPDRLFDDLVFPDPPPPDQLIEIPDRESQHSGGWWGIYPPYHGDPGVTFTGTDIIISNEGTSSEFTYHQVSDEDRE